jgi:hypothetical protein
MSYLNDWKNIKKRYEAATGKSKPGEKFLGLFRKSSGIEKATEAVDKAIAKNNAKALRDAVVELQKAATQYATALLSATSDALMEKELKRLKKDLVELVANANSEKLGSPEAGADERVAVMRTRIDSERTIISDIIKRTRSEIKLLRNEYNSIAEMIRSIASGKGSKKEIEALKKTVESRMKMAGVVQSQVQSNVEKTRSLRQKTVAIWKKWADGYTTAGLLRNYEQHDELVMQMVTVELDNINELVEEINGLKKLLADASARKLDQLGLLKKQIPIFVANVRDLRHRFYADASDLGDHCDQVNELFRTDPKKAVTTTTKTGLLDQCAKFIQKAGKALDSLDGNDLYKRRDAYIKILKAYDKDDPCADDLGQMEECRTVIETARDDITSKSGRVRTNLSQQDKK